MIEPTRRAQPYIELHCQSSFSFLRGASTVDALAERAAALGMPALGLTDWHGVYGAIRFQHACQRVGVKAIIGAVVVMDDPIRGGPLTLLARDRRGYANLCQLITRAHARNGPERTTEPAITFTDLAELHLGLVVLSGGEAGAIGQHLRARSFAEAVECARTFRDALGSAYWLELHLGLLPHSAYLLEATAMLGAAAGVRTVATNNVHYAEPRDYELADLLTCLRLHRTVREPHRERHPNGELYLKSAEQMTVLFDGYPEAVAATAEIAGQCQLDLLKAVCVSPGIPLPPEETPIGYLTRLCRDGMARRYPGDQAPDEVRTRAWNQLAHELDVIERLEVVDFFLVVHDIVSFAKAQHIRCAGRGSAANSLVAYLLGITEVDPLAHNLLFERFLNPERKGMPDIDVDFDSARRDEVIAYVERTYPGRCAMVANVITYRARSAVHDTARALGFGRQLLDELALALRQPHLRDATPILEQFTEDAKGQGADLTLLKKLMDLSARLVGLPRHLSLHNGGMLVTRELLSSVVPTQRSANGVMVAQWNKDDVEDAGFIKFDLLGLRTLGLVSDAEAMVRERDPDFDIDAVSLDDAATWGLICSGRTVGLFQIESPGQWDLIARTQPRSLMDLTAQVALFRPGPLQGGMVAPFIERRAGREPVTYLHPLLEPATRDTFGVIVYQEQILEIAHDFAGLSYGEADGFRRAMSHYRTTAEMEGMRDRFVNGAIGQGVPLEVANHVFELISYYSGYGFCRSHAAAFARTAYQTAWLRTHYPGQFFAAALNAEPYGFFPPELLIDEARRCGLAVLPVDINESAVRFTVAGPGAIRVGVAQVRGLSTDVADAIVTTRSDRLFTSLDDFVARCPVVDSRQVETLIRARAFDGLGEPARQLLWRYRQSTRVPTRPQQAPLFPPVLTAEAPPLPTPTVREQMAAEYRVQQFSPDHHPMDVYRERLQTMRATPLPDVGQMPDGQHITVAGQIISHQRPPTAKGMVFLIMTDRGAQLTIAVPPDLANQHLHLLWTAPFLVVQGRVQRRPGARPDGHGSVSVMARRVAPLTEQS